MSDSLAPPTGNPPPLIVPEGGSRSKARTLSFDSDSDGNRPASAVRRESTTKTATPSFRDVFEQLRMLHERLLEVHEIEIGNRPQKRKSVTISDRPESSEDPMNYTRAILSLPGATASGSFVNNLSIRSGHPDTQKSFQSSQISFSPSGRSQMGNEPSKLSGDEMETEQSEDAEFDLRENWVISKTTFMKMQKKRMPTTPSNFSRSGGNSGGDDAQSTPERRFFHEGEAVAPDQQSCVVRPASKPRLFWDMLAIFVLLYDLVSVPLDAFRLQQTAADVRMVFQFAVTLYWLLDIFASFATAVYVNGKLYMRHWDIAKAYCRSWFVFDVLVLVPDILVLVGDAQNAIEANGMGIARALRAGRLMRFLRFLRLLRIVKVFKLLYTLKVRINGSPFLLALNIVRFTVFALYLAHVLACVWWAVGDTELGWVWEEGLQDLPFWEQYTSAVQWAVSRVHPSTIQLSMQLKTPYERALAICASFGALGLSSLFISSITNTMADTSRKLQRKNQLLHSVREYCSAHFISASHAMSIKRYVEREHSRKKSLQTQMELLETLPQEILRELFHEARCQALQHHEFFDELGRKDPMMEMDLCSKAITESYILRSDKIFLPLETATAMYMLCNGRCRYTYEAPAPPTPLKYNRQSSQGSMLDLMGKKSSSVEKVTTTTVTEKVLITRKHCLSEHSIWVKDWVHRGLLEAYKDGWLLTMAADEAYKVIQSHPNSLVEATLQARYFVDALNLSYEESHFVTDLPFSFQPSDDMDLPKNSVSLHFFGAWKENLASVNPAEEAFAAA